MNKNQIFDFIVNKCASVCNVPAEDIKGASRRADVVDARCLVFRFAIQEYDFTPRDIATLLGKENPKAVRSLYQSFDTRCDRLFVFGRYYADAQSFNTAINQGLKVCLAELRKIEGLEGLANLTHYMSRHTWATLARSARLNIDKYTVHEALNHIDDSMRVTDIYISRDWSNIWEANAKVVGLVDWSKMSEIALKEAEK